MSVIVVATIWPAEGHRDEVVAALADAIDGTHAEAGCELYALHEGHDRLVMIEKWESRELLDAHSTGAVLAELGPRLEGKVSAPAEVLVLDSLPFGLATKGAL